MTAAAAKLLGGDLLRTGAFGLTTRRLRATLSALGIAIGIAAMVAVLGISQSSKADLVAALDRLGTNLLEVAPGQSLFGEQSKLPLEARAMLTRVTGVESVAAVEELEAVVRRTDYVPKENTGGISVLAADSNLLQTLRGRLRSGTFLTDASSRYPAVVLGSVAAERLGISSVRGGVQVFIEGRWFAVVGILERLPLAPDLDRSVFVGREVAEDLLGGTGHASRIYVRTDPDRVEDVSELLAATANPEHPEEVGVSRPSDAIEARAAAKSAFTSLFLGLGAVALLVGGVGVANVMVISVLERRSEIGLRRAIGATRRHIGAQFLTESTLLAALGGTAGVAIGALVTAAYAASRGWEVVVPVSVMGAGLAAAVAIGCVAGLYPAMRAARLSPTEALRSV